MKPVGYRAPRVQANPETVYDRQFRDFLPQQIEHILRLTLERLQKNHRDLTSHDIAALAQAAHVLYDIYTDVREEC